MEKIIIATKEGIFLLCSFIMVAKLINATSGPYVQEMNPQHFFIIFLDLFF